MKTLATTLVIVFWFTGITGCLQMPTKIYRKSDSTNVNTTTTKASLLPQKGRLDQETLDYQR